MRSAKRRFSGLVLALGLCWGVIGEQDATHKDATPRRNLELSSPRQAPGPEHFVVVENRKYADELQRLAWSPQRTNVLASSESLSAALFTITPAPDPELVRRQITNPFNPIDVLSASLNSAKAANAAATATINQLQQKIGQLQASVSQLQASVSQLQAQGQAAQSSAVGGAATANASVMSALSSAQMSASAAIDSVKASASAAVASIQDAAMKSVNMIHDNASKSINEALAMVTSASRMADAAKAEASKARDEADNRVNSAQGTAVSVTRAALSVVGAIIGTSLLSLFGFWLSIRYRRAKLYEKEEAERSGNAALNRAVLSYFAKGDVPSPTSPHPAVGYAISGYRNNDIKSRLTASRPSTADKSAIPGIGLFQLLPPRKSVGGKPLKSNPLETVREVDSSDTISESSEEDFKKDDGQERRASHWPLEKRG